GRMSSRDNCFCRGTRCIRPNWRSMERANGGVLCRSILPNSSPLESIAIRLTPPMVARRMKIFRALPILALVYGSSQILAGTARPTVASVHDELNPARFELAVESGYLLGFINSPHSYEIGAEFLTARVRWGVMQSDNW